MKFAPDVSCEPCWTWQLPGIPDHQDQMFWMHNTVIDKPKISQLGVNLSFFVVNVLIFVVSGFLS